MPCFSRVPPPPAHAQDATPNGAQDPGHPRVNQVDSRQNKQDSRVSKGDKSGELTKPETAHLDHKENSIQKKKASDQHKHNGHLTKTEQNNLDKRQNHVSKDIHQQKHDDNVQ